MAIGDKIYIADKQTLDDIKGKIGSTTDTGGTTTAGGIFAKLNAILQQFLSNWTDARAGKLDNLDTTISSRAPSSTALSTATWTNARAAKLDNLNATVSSRASAADLENLLNNPRFYYASDNLKHDFSSLSYAPKFDITSSIHFTSFLAKFNGSIRVKLKGSFVAKSQTTIDTRFFAVHLFPNNMDVSKGSQMYVFSPRLCIHNHIPNMSIVPSIYFLSQGNDKYNSTLYQQTLDLVSGQSVTHEFDVTADIIVDKGDYVSFYLSIDVNVPTDTEFENLRFSEFKIYYDIA